MTENKILFTPGLELETTLSPSVVAVKGQLPHLDYPFMLCDIYPTVAVLNTLQAYQRIVKEYERLEALLCYTSVPHNKHRFPSARDDIEASYLLRVLFSPRDCFHSAWPPLKS